MRNAVKIFWQKVVVGEKGDLVQNIMWLAFIALACVVAIRGLGEKLDGAADKATDQLEDAIVNE